MRIPAGWWVKLPRKFRFCYMASVPMLSNEKELASMAGWPVFAEGRALFRAGAVRSLQSTESSFRGRVAAMGKTLTAGLVFHSKSHVDNLCPCRESQTKGLICKHSVAVGLQFLSGSPPAEEEVSAPHSSAPPGVDRGRPVKKQNIPAPKKDFSFHADSKIFLEGSLRAISLKFSPSPAENPAGAWEEMRHEGFVPVHNGELQLSGEAGVRQFLGSVLPQWQRQCVVEIGERLAHVTRDFVPLRPQFQIGESAGGWFDFQWTYSDGSRAIFRKEEIQKLLASGKADFPGRDGKTLLVNAGQFADLDAVLSECEVRQENGVMRIPDKFREYVLASLGRGEGSGSVQQEPEKLPREVEALLRPYQLQGVRWMLALAEKGYGGLLADEMGLGKTLQALCLVRCGKSPSLVVCPSPLVWNWRREAEKFFPGMKVRTIEGRDRGELLRDASGADLLVTSYALLRRDSASYRELEFSTLILDEAQHIKNPDSQNFRAAASIPARARFVLSGTPVENSLRDLWSLFSFCLPGYLGERKDFEDRYVRPMEAGEDPAVASRLRRKIAPFVLRRTKAALLPELPPKIEQVLEVELTPEQSAAYTQLQATALERVRELGKSNTGAARMSALTAILRMRQICCDLRLLGKQLPPEQASAKHTALLELLQEAMDGEHRCLVFSQFTSLLDLVEECLAQHSIPHCRLDGSTVDREAVVKRFETTLSIPVFLISLKAGGTGLNLTSADTVIHLDPWWNPAVEDQATSRAHRMGQQRVVTSIKLVAKNTIETKIVELQKRKQSLFQSAMDGDAGWSSLTVEDLRELVS